MEIGNENAKKATNRKPTTPVKSNLRENFTKAWKNLHLEATAGEQPASNQTDLSSASTILSQLVNIPETKRLLDSNLRSNAKMIFSNGLTIWMLIHQRLCGGATLEQTVSHVLEHDRHLLPENKRTAEFTLSTNPSGYSAARKRLKLEQLEDFSHAVCDHLASIAVPVIGNRRVFIIDGTTITLAPTAPLVKAFPPAPNQHGESVWPVAMLMVAAELQTGCVLVPQVDPMFGPNRSSEAKQSRAIVQKLPANSIVLADAGFGIFSVAYNSQQAGHDLLFRLSQSRFISYLKSAKLIDSGDGYQSYSVDWTPSVKDRKSNPDLPSDAKLKVVLHYIERENEEPLYIVTNLNVSASSASELYSHRYKIEFDIRDLKVTMDTENIRARSLDMVMKELLASTIAFNLTMQFRRQAAKLAQVEPRRLSFKSCWVIFQDHLLLGEEENYSGWQARFTRALLLAGQKKLPQRKSPRSFPRKAHPRRPKSTKFMKKQVADNSNESSPTDPTLTTVK